MPECVKDLLKRIHGSVKAGAATATPSDAAAPALATPQGADLAQALIQALGHVRAQGALAPLNGHRKPAPKPSAAMKEALDVVAERGASSSHKNRKSQWKQALRILGDDWARWDPKVVASKIGNADYAKASKLALRDSLRLLHTILTVDLDYEIHDFAAGRLRTPTNAQREAEAERETPKTPYSIDEARSMIRATYWLKDRFPWLPGAVNTAFLTGMNIADIRDLRRSHVSRAEDFGRKWIKKKRVKRRDRLIHVPVSFMLQLPDDRRRRKKPIIGVPAGAYDALRELERQAGVEHVDGESWRRPRYLFASLLDQMGVPRAVRTRLLGHIPASQTAKYERANDQDLVDAVDAIGECLCGDVDVRRAWQRRLDRH